MSEIKIAGVMRAGAYSPNHVGNDAAIFNAAAGQLRRRGFEVNIYSEEQFQTFDIKEPVILNMCRERASIARLQAMENDGRVVVNSGFGIENCTRERMTRILLGHGIPYPDSLTVNTNENVLDQLERSGYEGFWIKRGDFHAMHKEDVSFCRHAQEAQEVLQEYFYRGIPRAVINRHLPGDLIKFYGVAGQPFFYWFYPFDTGHSKYGLEAINGHSQGPPCYLNTLTYIPQPPAVGLAVVVSGGDSSVGADGSIQIIDFNDWPSFAPCRSKAAPAIAKAVIASINARF